LAQNDEGARYAKKMKRKRNQDFFLNSTILFFVQTRLFLLGPSRKSAAGWNAVSFQFG